MPKPQPTESAPYYSRYIDLVQTDQILSALTGQLDQTLVFLETIDEQKSQHAYKDGKWTIKQVLNHVNDTERIFLYRAFWFARGFQQPLPGYEQDDCVVAAQANDVSWNDLVQEFRSVRLATISCFKNLPVSAWTRRGTANDNEFTVNALAYIIVGHVIHHTNVIKERYLLSA